MSNSYKVQQKCWMHPLKIMILFAWSWSTNIIYSKVNNKIFVWPCWFLLYTFEMPVTESPTAVKLLRTTLNWMILDEISISAIIMLTKKYNFTWFHWNFALLCCILFCMFFLSFCCCYCCCFIGKSKIDKLLIQKVVHLMLQNERIGYNIT